MTTTADDQPVAVLHDATRLAVTTAGKGPCLLIPVRTDPYDDATAATMRAWGGDPELGPTLMNGLADLCTVIAAYYEGHRLSHPAPATLTASNVAADLLAIADAAGADYGPKWGDTRVVIADAVRDHHDQLTTQGWTVRILPGLDHLSAMRGATVVPLVRGWLTAGAPGTFE